MFGINGGELILILVVIAIVVGPERLPAYAEQLGRWVRGMRAYMAGAKDRVAAELGTDDVDWEALDPRRYDPRRIVREALLDEPVKAKPRNVPRRYTPPPATGPAADKAAETASAGPAPFDDEAT